MYGFTDYGLSTEAPTEVAAFSPTEVRYLPMWLAAHQAAERAGYCEVYDNIVADLGGPTRRDLRRAGLLKATYAVTVDREVEARVVLRQSAIVEVEATSGAEARRIVEEDSGDITVRWPNTVDGTTVIEGIRRWGYYDTTPTDNFNEGNALNVTATRATRGDDEVDDDIDPDDDY